MGFWEALINFFKWIFGFGPTSDLSTQDLVREYLEDVADVTMDGEHEEFASSIPYISEKNKYGYYGAPMSTVIDGVNTIIGFIAMAECRVITEWTEDGMPKSGHMKFAFRFDPNNGFVYMLWIHPDFRTDKNKDITDEHYGDMKQWMENPDWEEYFQPVKD